MKRMDYYCKPPKSKTVTILERMNMSCYIKSS